jgi:hypothetical protein
MTPARKLGTTFLLGYTLVVTASRALRPPNDFAEAFWLLDYRFGFVKRALVGEIVSLLTTYFAFPITESVIAILSFTTFSIFAAALVVLSIRIFRKSGWSSEAVLVSLAFLSSPFVVMSAHLVGYHDNIVILLGILSIVALLKGRPWVGAILQGAAVLTNEISLLVVFPSFCLAWLLINRGRMKSLDVPMPIWPLILPVCVSLILVASHELFLARDFAVSLSAYLSRFPFIQSDRAGWVPVWVSTPFLEYLKTESPQFITRITWTSMYGLVVPSTLAILAFTAIAYRVFDSVVEPGLSLAACLAPQLLHLVAWDTSRIWTYSILCSFLVLWVWAEASTFHRVGPTVALLALGVIVANAIVLTPLMDQETDRFSLAARLLLYAPVFIGALAFVLEGRGLTFARRSGANESPAGATEANSQTAAGAPRQGSDH